MAVILQIETSTKVCSIALSQGEMVIFERITNENFSHAACLGGYVQEAVEYAKKNQLTIEAVAVSSGPGSYTGLRIGVSEAKGLCYGFGIPLIALPTLQIIAAQVRASQAFHLSSFDFLCPMIDARRMEVYSVLYDRNLEIVRDIQADIVNEQTYQEYLSQGKVAFFGDGSEKCKTVINHANALFIEDIYPLASAMVTLAEEAFEKRAFVDVAYFEPFYLKEFQATVGKNKLLLV